MSLDTVNQLKTDLDTLAKKNPSLECPPTTVQAYNANLADAKKAHPSNTTISALTAASDTETVAVNDLLVRTGQLHAALREEMKDRVRSRR